MAGIEYHIHPLYVGYADNVMTISAILNRSRSLGRRSIANTDYRHDDWQLERSRHIRGELIRTYPSGLGGFFGWEQNGIEYSNDTANRAGHDRHVSPFWRRSVSTGCRSGADGAHPHDWLDLLT